MTTPRPRLRFQLIAFFLTRTIINTMYRMVYPFMTVFARGMGVPVGEVAAAVAARSALGLAAPLLGSSADRRGRKRGMVLGLGVFVAGAAVVVLRPMYFPFVAALLLTGAGKIAFDPAMQAYLGDLVGYQRRGQAIALTEIGWSLAFLVGVPLMGWLIARGGWTAPFPWLAGLGAAAALMLWRMLPRDTRKAGGSLSLADGLRRIVLHRAALAGLAVGLLASAANEIVNIVFGVWLEVSFGLQVVALGAAAAVIGLAELSGEGLVATTVDRIGKRRAIAIGLILNCGACLLLPVLGQSVPGALLGLFCFYITFEFTLVSSIPLMTELVPEARATLMSGNISALSAGRVLGAAAGLALYSEGMRTNTLATILLNMAALAILLTLVRD
ncbi:MAG TPA: MFS transporter [Anaerolineales bacterium]|nr:MFS transporter [Anaerolineales bacterium]